MLASCLTAVFFSWSMICAGRSVRLIGSARANLWRLVIAAVLLALWAHSVGSGLRGAGLSYFVASGCIGFGIGDLAMFYALPRLGPRLTLLLVQCLAAPMAATVEWLWLGTTMTGLQLLCATVILGGVGLALAPERADSVGPRRVFAGTILGLLAAFGQGFGAVLSRKAYAQVHLAAQNVDGGTAAYQRILGGLTVALVGFWLSNHWRERLRSPAGQSVLADQEGGSWWRKAWLWIMGNSLTGPVLGVSCYQWALQATPTGIVLSIVATTPLVAMPFTFLIDGDRPRALAVAGALVAVVGAVALVLV